MKNEPSEEERKENQKTSVEGKNGVGGGSYLPTEGKGMKGQRSTSEEGVDGMASTKTLLTQA